MAAILPSFVPHPGTPVPTVTGADGLVIPVMAFGTGTAWFGATGGERAESMKAALMTALRLGFHHVDAAEMYTNQRFTGEALADFLAEQSEVKREHLFVVSKIANQSKHPDAVRASCARAIKELNCGSYLDLLLVLTRAVQRATCPFRLVSAVPPQFAWWPAPAPARPNLGAALPLDRTG